MKTLEDLFKRHNRSCNEGELRIWAYLCKPSAITKTADVVRYDNTAMRAIKECEEALALLNSYREELQKRYAALETMSYTDRLELKRNTWRGIEYTLRIIRTYSDGSEVDIRRSVYPGRERAQAIRDFKALKRSRPNLQAIEDITPRRR